MTNLHGVNNTSTDSSSGSTSDSTSSGSSSTSSGSASTSSDSDSSASDAPAVSADAQPKSPSEPAEEAKKKEEPKQQRRLSKATKVSSSSDDDNSKAAEAKPLPPRRRCSAKPKAAIAVLAKGRTTPRAAGAKTPKHSQRPARPIPKLDQKKKSIFSPDNSSESEAEAKDSKSPNDSPKPKRESRKSSDEKEASSVTPTENEDNGTKDNVKRRSSNRSSGPPPKKAVEEKSASSCSSSQSSIDSVSSESDSETASKKDSSMKTGKTKPPSNTSNKDTTEKSGESGENTSTATMPRKLTRSLSARVSRLATISRPTNTDTDSDPDDKNNDSKSSSVSSNKDSKKGSRGRPPLNQSPMPVLPPPEPSERRCHVMGCDSSGHLGGKADKHFTWDACPIYHNVTGAWCVAAGEERVAAAGTRRRALHALQHRPRAMPTIEQRAYQLKVKDMRSKWKGSQELREKLAASGDDTSEEREPILDGFAPDYDMRLFREAQALAAIKIEEDLGDLYTDKGTRYVVMGKYMMEVWYQSPYGGEAERVPRLFVCEFCLNHHTSATGADRHKA
ncbi:hypothetical protein ACJJTC_003240, partial [Scirpophaga incertulas]